MSAPPSPPSLSAVYSSPAATRTFSHPTSPLTPSHLVQEKSAYLSSLRTSVTKMQEEVNAFLTQKMEEDNAQAKNLGVDEQKAEENYGEEVGEED